MTSTGVTGRAMLGVGNRRKLTDDDPRFRRRVQETAHARGARGPDGGPPTDFDGAFWRDYNTRYRGHAGTVRALGMRWQALKKKLARREAASMASAPSRSMRRHPARQRPTRA